MAETKTAQMIYRFEEGNKDMKELLGGKGANLAEMTRMNFPVPPGFTITTEVCREYYRLGKRFPDGLKDDIRENVKAIETKMGKQFGGADNPLLLSVRSGAKFSMPGMMDTILNLGLNAQTVEGMIKKTGNPRFVLESYRRFIHMYSDVVLGIPKRKFEELLSAKKAKYGFKEDSQVTPEALTELIGEYKALVKRESGQDFPEDVWEQLFSSVEAVFASWNNERAIIYRNKEGISHDLGTAVNVQSMVFGNLGDTSGTGVAFTRNASTGENALTGDYLINAQGEDVVAGVRTPLKISALKEKHPDLYEKFSSLAKSLEKHYSDLQDLEFTVEDGKLYLLQTRSAKRTAQAAVTVARDLVGEGLITKEEAVMRINPEQIDQLLHPYFSTEAKAQALKDGKLLAKGTPASPGAACGKVVFTAEEAIREAAHGPVVLVRPETTPDDAGGMLAAKGILTSTGGPTSHAALVARGWGIPCVVGCEAVSIDEEKGGFKVGGKEFKAGAVISIDGATGEVIEGSIELVYPSDLPEAAKEILAWADGFRKLGVYANADNPKDAKRARSLGATGIGLCRTEHMFMGAERMPMVQRMILSAGEAERLKRMADRLEVEALEKKGATHELLEKTRKELEGPWKEYMANLAALEALQKEDFRGILKEMEGHWVIIRLLDPPLHEFLPPYEELLVEIERLKLTGGDAGLIAEKEKLLEKVKSMKEFNPMLGLRVCRLGIVFPEIFKMQVRAILEAACELKAQGVDVKPEIMIPGVGHINEMKFNREMVDTMAKEVFDRKGLSVIYKVGTMMELPRACTIAGKLAQVAQFFSFGTNDLTQTTFGYSRDDASKSFIPVYLEKGILETDPFQILDREGVGRLMTLAVKEGREANPELEVGICGEHGGEPNSIAFCHSLNLNYVSCSPYRVPIARLAAAQTALKEKAAKEYSNK